jgi:hypothetical protein
MDRWDKNHVHMPCSQFHKTVSYDTLVILLYYFLLIKRNGQPLWPIICQWLVYLKQKCDSLVATFQDLKVIISNLTCIRINEILH